MCISYVRNYSGGGGCRLVQARIEKSRADAATRVENPDPNDSIAPLKSVKFLSSTKVVEIYRIQVRYNWAL